MDFASSPAMTRGTGRQGPRREALGISPQQSHALMQVAHDTLEAPEMKKYAVTLALLLAPYRPGGVELILLVISRVSGNHFTEPVVPAFSIAASTLLRPHRAAADIAERIPVQGGLAPRARLQCEPSLRAFLAAPPGPAIR